MNYKNSAFKNSGLSKVVITLSTMAALFWFLGHYANVYRYAWVGVIFEILWLPFLAMLFVLPILSIILWFKDKFNKRSFFLHSILIIAATFLLMLLKK